MNKTDKISIICETAVNQGYIKEVEYICEYLIKNDFKVIINDAKSIKNKYDSMYYLDLLSCDISECFNLCYDAFITSNLYYDALIKVYDKKDLDFLDYSSICVLMTITDKLNWKYINSFETVETILKTVLINYISSFDVLKINDVFIQYMEYNLCHKFDKTICFEFEDIFYASYDDFETYKATTKKEYLKHIINTFNYDDIVLLIDYCL